MRRTTSPSSSSRPSASSWARTGEEGGTSNCASTSASSQPVRITSALPRVPRRSARASTRMLLPAPVSPVITVRPGPKLSSTRSMSAKPEMRRNVSMLPCPFPACLPVPYLNIVLPEHAFSFQLYLHPPRAHGNRTPGLRQRAGAWLRTGLARAPAAPIAVLDLGWGWAPAGAGASAGLCRRGDWVPCAGHSTPRAQVGRRPVAVHVEREGGNSPKPPVDWSSRSPRTALFPDGPPTPDDHHCASAGHRLATTGRRQGSRVPIHSAIERFAVMREDQLAWRVEAVAIFPHAVNRNRAPAHLRSRVEWPAHGTQSSRRRSTALAMGAGRRPSPTPTREPACLASPAAGGRAASPGVRPRTASSAGSRRTRSAGGTSARGVPLSAPRSNRKGRVRGSTARRP